MTTNKFPENEMLPETIKENDVPQILIGLEHIQNTAIQKLVSYKIILSKVRDAKRKIFKKFPKYNQP